MTTQAREEKVLIFPAGMPRSVEFQRRCEQAGTQTIGASSLLHDPSRQLYAEWSYLPYVVDPGFPSALTALIRDRSITGIFTPNLVVWDQLAALLPTLPTQVSLVNTSPAAAEVAPYLEVRRRADEALALPLDLAAATTARARADGIALAAIYRMVDNVPGMCDHDKMAALCEVARHMPTGDIVEIGSWWGKSAVLLQQLSQHYDLGSVLCVDPWSDEHLLQRDATLVDRTAQHISADQAFEVFELNLLPIARGRLNYLRMTSVAAAAHYRDHRHVGNPRFGGTDYAGRLALLHIDGNHDYAAVMTDIDQWQTWLGAGSWVVFDDYVWPYGDGPRRVADLFCAQNLPRMACAFVMGSALFVQLLAPV